MNRHETDCLCMLYLDTRSTNCLILETVLILIYTCFRSRDRKQNKSFSRAILKEFQTPYSSKILKYNIDFIKISNFLCMYIHIYIYDYNIYNIIA